MLKVLVFSDYFEPGYKAGGPIKTIKNLFARLDGQIEFKLVTRDRDIDSKTSYSCIRSGSWNHVNKVPVFYTRPKIKGLLQIYDVLRNSDFDIVYLNSFFSLYFSFVPLLIAKLLNQKVVLSPRGELSLGALSLKSLKKKIFISLFKFLQLHKNIVFQASSQYEARNIYTTLGDKVDVQVAENISSQEFVKQLKPRSPKQLRVVFLSRIAPMKNLDFALEVLKQIQYPIEYHIFGPIEDEKYWAKCEQIISELPSNIQVIYSGKLKPTEVINTLAEYDAFFMPTKGENYGHVITESLCAGLPILIANTTPWRDLQTDGIGWDLPLNEPDSFRKALSVLATMPPEEHLKMRKKVLIWAENKFSQRDAIEANALMFRYVFEKN